MAVQKALSSRVAELFATGMKKDLARKETEAGDLYGAILASAPEGIVAVDPQGRIVFTNPKTDAMFGYASGSLVGEQPVRS